MKKKISASKKLSSYGLFATLYHQNPPREVDEIYYYVDDVSGDGRGIS